MTGEVESAALRRSVLLAIAVVLTYVVVGALAGVVWEQHQLYYTDYGSLRRVFTGTGLYALVAAVASALVALAAGLLTRRYELLMLAAVLVGSLAAAYTMHAVGVALGPPDPATLAAVAADGTHVSGQLEVHGKSPYAVWPMVSLFVLSLVFFAWPGTRSDRGRAESTGAAAGGLGTTDLPPERQRLLEQIGAVTFTPVRIRQGYDIGAVDRLLDDAAATVTRGEPLVPVLDVTLPTVRWREGYDMAEVRTFLDGLRVSADGMDTRT